MMASGGCGLKGGAPAHSVALRGYADLDELVHHHPGWAGVAQYDMALMRLQNATVRLHVPAGDKSLSSLPADELPLPPVPAIDRKSQQQRLETLKQNQIARLRSRRAQSRAAEVFPLQEAWQREASEEYIKTAQSVQAAYLRPLRQGLLAQNPQRLNLILQIRALQNTIEGWKVSPPPAPVLQQTRADLAQKQAELARLEGLQAEAARAAAVERDQQLAEARSARSAYVETRTQQKLAALKAQDELQIASFEVRLARQERALLLGPAGQTVAVIASGQLSTEALPENQSAAQLLPGSAARSEAQLALAEQRLRRQRARWLTFLYDDTRSAALDMAQQQHWQLSFGKTGTGTALTEPLARLLTATAWKS